LIDLGEEEVYPLGQQVGGDHAVAALGPTEHRCIVTYPDSKQPVWSNPPAKLFDQFFFHEQYLIGRRVIAARLPRAVGSPWHT